MRRFALLLFLFTTCHMADAAAQSPASEPAAVPAAASQQPALQIPFITTATELPLSSTAPLNAFAEQLLKDETSQVLIIGYASGSRDNASISRRVSLTRALAVRTYLLDKGVNKQRVRVRALGNKHVGGEADRIDIFLTESGAPKPAASPAP